MESEIAEIRDLAERFTPEEIEGCLTEQISTGKNVCLTGESAERTINELAKAEFVRDLMDKEGMSLADALRELARRIRQFKERTRE